MNRISHSQSKDAGQDLTAHDFLYARGGLNILSTAANFLQFVDDVTAFRGAVFALLNDYAASPSQDPFHPAARPSAAQKKATKVGVALKFIGRLGRIALSVPTDPALKSYSSSHPNLEDDLRQLFPMLSHPRQPAVRQTSQAQNPPKHHGNTAREDPGKNTDRALHVGTG